MTARTCPACSTPLAESDAYCPRCGVAATNTQRASRRVIWPWILAGVVIACPGALIGGGFVASFVAQKMIDDVDLPVWEQTETDIGIDEIMTALHEHAIRNGGTYPDSLDALVTPDESGYRYLATSEVPRDPWGRTYLYEPPDAANPEPRVWSLGGDGVPHTGDELESGRPHGMRDGLEAGEPADTPDEARAQADIVRILAALNAYALRNAGTYPDDLAPLVVPDQTGARYLASDGVPIDPWGNEYEYDRPSSPDLKPRVWSDGPDGMPGGGDDVGSPTVRDGR